MKERDIEDRLRSVVDGPKPKAPDSLHKFLREMPRAERHLGPIGRVRRALVLLPGFSAPSPVARRAQLAFTVSMAIVVGVAGGALMMSMRQNPVQAPAGATSRGGPFVTPRQSLSTHQPAVKAELGSKLSSVICLGLPSVATDNMAQPTTAIVTRGGKFLGVTGGTYGMTGLVRSEDGLYWDWSPPSTVAKTASILTSIATDHLETIVVAGGVQDIDGTMDGSIWVSGNDGKTWHGINDESVFKGTTVRVVVYGSGQFVALGWNDASAADSLRQVAEWRSDDGVTWTRVTAPIKGTSALIAPTPSGFLLSGTPLTAGAIDEPPMWWSVDGQTWTRSTADDNTAQLMGPLMSATVTAGSSVYGVSSSSDGVGTHIVASSNAGRTWTSVTPDESMQFATKFSSVASLTVSAMTARGYVDLLFATTNSNEGAQVWLSDNGGVTWMEVSDPNIGGPSGNMLLQIGNGYPAGSNKILVMGEPGNGLGIWIMSLAGY